MKDILFIIRGVASFPWAIVQGSRMGLCMTFETYSHAFL